MKKGASDPPRIPCARSPKKSVLLVPSVIDAILVTDPE